MAGAVSAGAYTAGVMDYLTEVLDNWERAKARNHEVGENHEDYDASIPMHDVELTVLSGASAGGITAVVAAAALHGEIPHVVPESRQDEQRKSQNKFYDTWVNMMQDNMMFSLLDNSDIEKEGLVALLNSSFKEQLAEKALQQKGQAVKRAYVPSRLDILVTLSNLEGIPFELGFKSATSKNVYYSRWQRDYGHFQLTEEPYNGNGRIPVSFNSGAGLDTLKQAAMATGAFPVGLRSRLITRERKYIEDNPFINPLVGQLDKLQLPEQYQTLNVDGGMLNNEPFDITRRILFPEGESEKQRLHDQFEGTILMIDPFPSTPPEINFKNHSLLLTDIIPKILSTMRSQLLFKEDDIEAAFSDDDYSRFLIAPKRGNMQGEDAIACGSLGGFGGFFSKKFREHDFYLGRRNCQRFLRTVLGVPASTQNPIFAEGYPETARKRFGFTTSDGEQMVPILPDLGHDQEGRHSVEPKPVYPKFSNSELNALFHPMKDRLKYVALSLTEQDILPSFLVKVAFLLKGRKITRKLSDTIQKQFTAHNLM